MVGSGGTIKGTPLFGFLPPGPKKHVLVVGPEAHLKGCLHARSYPSTSGSSTNGFPCKRYLLGRHRFFVSLGYFASLGFRTPRPALGPGAWLAVSALTGRVFSPDTRDYSDSDSEGSPETGNMRSVETCHAGSRVFLDAQSGVEKQMLSSASV